MANREIQPGSKFPANATVKEDNPEQTFHITKLTGRNVFVGVPGAFTGACSAQIPGYISTYEQFKEKGINNVYVVAVNDVFVLKAWKTQMAPDGTKVRFIADDKAELTLALGMLFDATPLLGGPRSKRYVVVTDGDKIISVAVEPVPGEVTVTAADKVLPLL
ncbi:Redoxin [Thelephora ganbajun]|uniref:Redoxin n=1 Tax=Thelephora ganbajun TaxID=370292 RepID=A0ACB6ZKS5_THEGA|nr:Redoxin [Thelephora ganbajun]